MTIQRQKSPKVNHRRSIIYPLFCALLYPAASGADGIVISNIEHPYVQPFEQELEWSVVVQDNQPGTDDHIQSHQLAYGQSLNDRWFVEAGLIGEKSETEDFDIEAYELEAKWQLTDQGELSADWGVLFELEKEAHRDVWELAAGLLAEKEWGKWSGTANFFIAQEWGSDIADELETSLGLQARYRYSKALEPAIEFYSGQDTLGLGPVFLGQVHLGIEHQIKWEVGVIFGLDNKSPNQTLRLLVEIEL